MVVSPPQYQMEEVMKTPENRKNEASKLDLTLKTLTVKELNAVLGGVAVQKSVYSGGSCICG